MAIPANSPSKPPLQGFGGWLLGLVILDCVFILTTTIRLGYNSWHFVVGWPGLSLADSRAAATWLILGEAVILGVSAYALILLVERRVLFVKIFTLQLVLFTLEPLAQIPSLSIIAGALGVEFDPLTKVGHAVVNALIAGMLWQYVRTSIRVRNTLVN